MPIDPRIALAGVSPTYDFMGAYNTSRAAAQTAQANQMAMQAAEATATAQRNAMLEARTLDPTNQEALRAYALRNPAAAEQVLGGLASADNLFSARGTEARAQKGFETEQSEAYMTQLPRFASQFLGVADIPGTAARIRPTVEASGFPTELFDTYVRQLSEMDPAQAQQALQSYLLTTGGGETVVKTRYPNREMATTATGQEAVNLSSLALDPTTGAPVPITGPLSVPAEKPINVISTDEGMVAIYADGRTELLQAPGGGALQEAAPPPTPAQQQAEAEAVAKQTSQANARQDVNGTLESMMAEYDNLYRLGAIVSTDRTGAQNVGAAAGASLPGRVAGRALGLEAQTARDNIAAALPQIMLGLQTASGLSSTQLNSNAELQFFKRILGDPDASYQTVVNAIERFQRFADSLLGGAGGAAPPTPRAPPQAGEVRAGYRFRGGDPGNQTNWTPVR